MIAVDYQTAQPRLHQFIAPLSRSFTNTFKTKHLNVWVSAKSAFFNMVSWKACEDRSLTLEQFAGEECVLAFDLARKLDMNSMARLFWRDIDGLRHYYCVSPRFWVPEDRVHDDDNKRMSERFQAWLNTGHLYATAGAEVDYREILAEALEANEANPVRESPIDPFGATGLSHEMDDEGLTPVVITQNYTNMSSPMKELEAAIASGRFHHDGKPPRPASMTSASAACSSIPRRSRFSPCPPPNWVGRLRPAPPWRK